jgi:hypothetical protein
MNRDDALMNVVAVALMIEYTIVDMDDTRRVRVPNDVDELR